MIIIMETKPKHEYKVLLLVFVGWSLVVLVDLAIVPLLFTDRGREWAYHIALPSLLLYGISLGFILPGFFQDKPFRGKPFWQVLLIYCLSIITSSLIIALTF
jgi:hypothetical protein